MPYLNICKRRDEISYAKGLKKALGQNKPFQGIKGVCMLSKLKFYSPVKSTQIDLMHTIGLGVVKELFERWFDTKKEHKPYSLRKYVKQIEARYMIIRPPAYVMATPRCISEYSLWKAKEFINFVLLYSLPVFYGIMDDVHFKHLIKLVVSLEILLDKKIKRIELQVAEKLLKSFVRDSAKLYQPNIMKSGVHELLHLVDCTKEIGPLVSFSTFQFEELNRKLLRFVKGRDLMGEEFFKLFVVMQELHFFTENFTFENKSIQKFISENASIKTTNRKKRRFNEFSFEISKVFNFNLNSSLDLDTQLFYESLLINGVTYCRFNDFTKFNNSCISYENVFGQIEAFFIKDDEPFVIFKKINVIDTIFYDPKYPLNKQKSFRCSISEDILIAPAKVIKKAFFIKIDDNLAFVNFYSTSHFFT